MGHITVCKEGVGDLNECSEIIEFAEQCSTLVPSNRMYWERDLILTVHEFCSTGVCSTVQVSYADLGL